MAVDELGLAVKRVTKLNGNGPIKAFCDIAIAESYLIRSVKVIEGKHGLFVSMPREQGKNGQWYDMFAPLTKGARHQLMQTVLEAYNTDGNTER